MKKLADILFTDKVWAKLYSNVVTLGNVVDDEYYELLGTTHIFDVMYNCIASQNKNVFDYKKAEAMLKWYEKANRTDKSILEYFPEYGRCIDEHHKAFNSNYGIYAKDGLKHCIKALSLDSTTRQACFLINNKKAMSETSIDKLCTNAVMFFIRRNTLMMIVQMRSSNMLTLLPYDMFIFSTWYFKVYKALKIKYKQLTKGYIMLQIASLHLYKHDAEEKSKNPIFNIENPKEYSNFLKHLM